MGKNIKKFESWLSGKSEFDKKVESFNGTPDDFKELLKVSDHREIYNHLLKNIDDIRYIDDAFIYKGVTFFYDNQWHITNSIHFYDKVDGESEKFRIKDFTKMPELYKKLEG